MISMFKDGEMVGRLVFSKELTSISEKCGYNDQVFKDNLTGEMIFLTTTEPKIRRKEVVEYILDNFPENKSY